MAKIINYDKRRFHLFLISEIFYLFIFFGLWVEFHLYYKWSILNSETTFLLIVAAPFIYFLAFHIYYIFVSFKMEELKYLRKTAILLFLFRILLLSFVFVNWFGGNIVLDAIYRSGKQPDKNLLLFKHLISGSIEIIPYLIFEICFIASFFVKELENKRKIMIVVFLLSLVCFYILQSYGFMTYLP